MLQRIARRTLLCAFFVSALAGNWVLWSDANEEIPRFAGKTKVATAKSYTPNILVKQNSVRQTDLSSRLNSSIDNTVDPCDDFHSFTCGSLKESAPEDAPLTGNWFHSLPYNNTFRNYLESAEMDFSDPNEKAIHQKVRQFYDACRQPLLPGIAQKLVRNNFNLDSLFDRYDEESFRKFFALAMAQLTLLRDDMFFEISDESYNVSDGFMYSITPGRLSSYTENEEFNETLYDLAEKFATSFEEAQNLSPNAIVDFVKSFKAVNDSEDTQEFKDINELQSNITWFDWESYFSELDKLAGDTPLNSPIAFTISNPEYFDNLGELLENTSAQAAIKEVIRWRMIVLNMEYLWESEETTENTDEYCVRRVMNIFDLVYLHIVDQEFPDFAVKEEYRKIFDIIKDEVDKSLIAVGFQDASFLNRFRDIKLDIEIPEIVRNSKMLREYYNKLTFSSDDRYSNEQSVMKYRLSYRLRGWSPNKQVNDAIFYHLYGATNYSPQTNTVYVSPIPEFQAQNHLDVPSLGRFATRGFNLATSVLQLLGYSEFLPGSRSGDKDKVAFQKLDNYRSCVGSSLNETNIESSSTGGQIPLNLGLSIAEKLWRKFDDGKLLDIPYGSAEQFYLLVGRGFCGTAQDEEERQLLSDSLTGIMKSSIGFNNAFNCHRKKEDVCQFW